MDELDESSVRIDATIDYYPNIEIVCFNTKEIQDAYASQWGIVPVSYTHLDVYKRQVLDDSHL